MSRNEPHQANMCRICTEVSHFKDNGWSLAELANAVGDTRANVARHVCHYQPSAREWARK